MSNVNTLNVGGTNFPIEDTEARRRIAAVSEVVAGDPSALGTNVQAQFAAEINAAPFSGDVWAWVKARIVAGNFDGLNVGDFIPFSADGNSYKAEIAGINTYKRYGDVEPGLGNHIDFITRDCHPTTFVWNKANYNNGIVGQPYPWLSSDIYARLNSLAINVPSAAVIDGAPVAVDYTTTGILTTLPVSLQNVIVTKRQYSPRRQSNGVLLVDDNSGGWIDMGKLWLPTEIEVYGCNMWGSVNSPLQAYDKCGSQQYPIFSCKMRRVKGAGDGGARSTWWLSTPRGGNSTGVAYVNSSGYAGISGAAASAVRVPLCFRIA